MRIIATHKSPNEVLINVFAEAKSSLTKNPEYTLEFWRGFGLTLASRNDPHRCTICGRDTPAERGTGAGAKKVVGWVDITRPEGDIRVYAHPECLERVHDKPELHPASLSYCPREDTKERTLQRRAIKRLIAEGVEKIDAWKLCSYRDGKAPRIIREVLDREFAPLPSDDVVEPMLGDMVKVQATQTGIVTGIARSGAGPTYVTSFEVRGYSHSIAPARPWETIAPLQRADGESLFGKRYAR